MRACCVIAAHVLLCAAAVRESDVPPGDGWKHARVVMTDGSSEDATVMMIVETVYTPRTDVPGTALYCYDGRLRVRFATRPIDLRSTLLQFRPLARFRTIALEIDGQERERTDWAYIKDTGLLIAETRKPAAQTFNAIAKAQTIKFEFRGATIEPHTPPIDDEFREWIDGCKKLDVL